MNDCHKGNCLYTRKLLFHGTRHEALERLPELGCDERLELGVSRISLVTDQSRVDLRFRVEAWYPDALRPGRVSALEFSFAGQSEQAADLFVYRFLMSGKRLVH